MMLLWLLVAVHSGRYIGCVVVTVVTTTPPSTPPPQTPTEFVDVICCPVLQTDISYWRQNCKYLSIQQDAFVWSREIRPFSLSSLSILFVIDTCPLILHRCLENLCPQVSAAVWHVVARTCKVPLPEFSKPNLSKYLLTSNYFFGVASSPWRWSALPNFCNRATWLFIVHPPPPSSQMDLEVPRFLPFLST